MIDLILVSIICMLFVSNVYTFIQFIRLVLNELNTFDKSTQHYKVQCEEYRSQLFDQIKQSSIDRKLILHLEACLHERKLTIRELQKQLEERG